MTDKILILGLSKSGIAAAKLAKKRGYDVYITERKTPKEEFLTQVEELKTEASHYYINSIQAKLQVLNKIMSSES